MRTYGAMEHEAVQADRWWQIERYLLGYFERHHALGLGSTTRKGVRGLVAQAEGFRAVLIEREAAYIEIIKKRIAASQPAQAASIAEQLDLVSLLDPAA